MDKKKIIVIVIAVILVAVVAWLTFFKKGTSGSDTRTITDASIDTTQNPDLAASRTKWEDTSTLSSSKVNPYR